MVRYSRIGSGGGERVYQNKVSMMIGTAHSSSSPFTSGEAMRELLIAKRCACCALEYGVRS